jgi:hypothetical protein
MVDKRAQVLALQSISSASRFGEFKICRQGNHAARQAEPVAYLGVCRTLN